MSKQINKALVPNLRFPEFWEEKAWQENGILDIASMKARIGWQNLRQDEHLESGKYYLVTGTDFVLDRIDWFHAKFVSYERYIQDQNIILKERDVLITKDGSIGKVAFVSGLENKQATLNNGIFRIRVENENAKFIFYTFLSSRFKNFLDKLSGGSSIKHLYQKDFEKYEVAYPTINEQQKIANCLSSIDDLITAQAQKTEALKAHKKGLMQQLFPREGETVPRVRFPEFLDVGEWEEIDIGSIGKVSMCKRILKSETKVDGDIPFYKIGTFGKQADAYISKETYEDYKSKYSYPKKGDILISASGTIGRLVVFNGVPAYFQDSNIVWIDNYENLVKNSFLFYCYENIKWATDDNTISRLYNDNLRRMKVVITTIPEQQKIANCLSSIDDLITAQAQKIEALKAHKKGLMQQLFPAADEMST